MRLSSHGSHAVSVDEFITRKLSLAERANFEFHKNREMNRVRCWMSLIRVIHVVVSLRVHTRAEHCIRHQWRCYSTDCFIKSISRGDAEKAFSGDVNSVVQKISCRKVNNAIVPQLDAQKLKILFDKKKLLAKSVVGNALLSELNASHEIWWIVLVLHQTTSALHWRKWRWKVLWHYDGNPSNFLAYQNIKEKKLQYQMEPALKCDLQKNYVAIKKKISQQGM